LTAQKRFSALLRPYPSEKLAEAKDKVAKELKSASVPSKYLAAATEIGKVYFPVDQVILFHENLSLFDLYRLDAV
jgi:hypothetical protein